MFSVFGGSSQGRSNPKSASLFSENDIREVLSSFHINDSDHSQDLVLSSSKGDLIKREELLLAIKRDTEQGEGVLSLSKIGEKYHVDEETLDSLLQDQGWVYTTANNRSILTNEAQDTLVSVIHQKTQKLFQSTKSLSSGEVSSETLMRLLTSRSSDTATTGLVIAPSKIPEYLQSAGIEVYSSHLLDMVKKDVMTCLDQSHNSALPVSWGPSEFHGLMAQNFHNLVNDVITSSESSNSGQLSYQEEKVTFEPVESLSKARNAKLQLITDGQVPYMSFKDLIGSHPSQFSTIADVKAVLDETGNSSKIQFSGNSAISLLWIKPRLNVIIVDCNKHGYAGLGGLITSFPEDARQGVDSFILDQLKANPDVSRAGDFALSRSWTKSLEKKAMALSLNLAQSVWDRDDQVRPKQSTIESQLKDEIGKSESIDRILVDSVWISEDRHLAKLSIAAYDVKVEELDSHCDTQFNVMWNSRVISKIQLYSNGLVDISEQGLRDQLTDLLKVHITTELVPGAANRAKSKGLLKSPRHKVASRLPKLQSSLPGKKDLPAVIDELGKFGGHIELTDLNEEYLQDEKTRYVKEMVKTMQKDEDSARLLLCFLIVLFGTKHQGIIYATGKFAPKILKMLKPELSSEDGEWLNNVKDSVKAGTTTDEMKNKMRTMATDLVKVIEGH